jgi:hypothetical protein
MAKTPPSWHERVAAIREQLAQAQRTIRDLPSQPLAGDDYAARLDGLLAGFQARPLTLRGGRDDASALRRAFEGAGPDRTDLLPVLAVLLPDRLRDLLVAQAPQRGDGYVPLADRGRVVREAMAEVDRLEREEEQTIRDAEAAGVPIARRPDCRIDLVIDADEAAMTFDRGRLVALQVAAESERAVRATLREQHERAQRALHKAEAALRGHDPRWTTARLQTVTAATFEAEHDGGEVHRRGGREVSRHDSTLRLIRDLERARAERDAAAAALNARPKSTVGTLARRAEERAAELTPGAMAAPDTIPRAVG